MQQPPQIQTPTPPWSSNRRRGRPPSLFGPSFSRSAFAADADAGAAPTPPWASNPLQDRPSSLLSPSFSRSAFTATAAAAATATATDAAAGDGDRDADATEYPCVTLFEWWLESVEGDDQKIAVGGFFERNQSVEELGPAAIAKRHGLCSLETEDGIILLIYGTLNMLRTHANGYTIEVCEKFRTGFPDWWQTCNQRYPKVTSSSGTSNSEVDPTQFYLKQFMLGEHILSYEASLLSKPGDSVNSSSQNDAAFQKSSYLSNGAPRFEECTCDGDIIATNKNVAASNDDGERHEAVRNEVDNVEMHLTASKALRERDDIPTNEDGAASKDNIERCTAVSEEVHSMEIGVIMGSTIRERGHDDITNVSLAPTVECTNDAVNEGVDNTSLLGRKKTPVASLNSQGCQEKHQHIPSDEKTSGPRKKQRSALEKLQGATRSPLTSPVPHASGLPKKQRSALEKMQGATRSPLASPVSHAHESPLTRGRATTLSMSTPEALKLRKTRSGRVVVPSLDAGCQRIVYDEDGMITGVIGLDSPSPKGSNLKTYSRKKREAEPAAGGRKMKTYARKKRRAE